MASEAQKKRLYNRTLRFLYMVGSANEDAESKGIAEPFKAEMKDLLDTFRITGLARPILLCINRHLGEGWEPSGQWADKIAELK